MQSWGEDEKIMYELLCELMWNVKGMWAVENKWVGNSSCVNHELIAFSLSLKV